MRAYPLGLKDTLLCLWGTKANKAKLEGFRRFSASHFLCVWSAPELISLVFIFDALLISPLLVESKAVLSFKKKTQHSTCFYINIYTQNIFCASICESQSDINTGQPAF